jgi:hypothetical protein
MIAEAETGGTSAHYLGDVGGMCGNVGQNIDGRQIDA